eukprot:TRINITY_DN2085_c0_g2_i1.p1 TRINITY_DN2085_c0_g2~~TRINITY_DN2085_c0_g2_i1.p1  ORF type:complete len:454 (+),score=86.33 TRINITY_DN2085_c0_g2_i1:51-1364(+)
MAADGEMWSEQRRFAPTMLSGSGPTVDARPSTVSPSVAAAAAAAAERRPATAPEGVGSGGGTLPRPRAAGRVREGRDGQGLGRPPLTAGTAVRKSTDPSSDDDDDDGDDDEDEDEETGISRQVPSPLCDAPTMAPTAAGGWRRAQSSSGHMISGGAALKAAQAEMDRLLASSRPDALGPGAPDEGCDPGHSAGMATARLRRLCDEVDAERAAVTREMTRLRGMRLSQDSRERERDSAVTRFEQEQDDREASWDRAVAPRMSSLQRSVEAVERRRSDMAVQWQRDRSDLESRRGQAEDRLAGFEQRVGSCGTALQQQGATIEDLAQSLHEERRERRALQARLSELERRVTEQRREAEAVSDEQAQRLREAEETVVQQAKEIKRLRQVVEDLSGKIDSGHVRDCEWRLLVEQEQHTMQKKLVELQAKVCGKDATPSNGK